jgi:hypothetical protein
MSKKALKVGDQVVIRSGRDGGARETVTGAQGCTVQVRLDPTTDRPARTLHLLPGSVKKIPVLPSQRDEA